MLRGKWCRPLVVAAFFALLVPLLLTGPGLYGDGGGNQYDIPERADLEYPNLSFMLNQLVARVEAGENLPTEAAQTSPVHQGSSIAVTIYLSDHMADAVQFLDENGASPRNVGQDYIEAYVPVTLLGLASERPGVTQVRLIIPPQPLQGTPPVTGQGALAHGSAAWNHAGYRGQGVKVGIIDTSFDGFRNLVGTELPATVRGRCYTDLGEFTENLVDCEAGSIHGTVVSESVMDIAPEVSLYIANPQSPGDLQAVVDWMISEEVSVINHSIGWLFDGPGDGTSPNSNSPLKTVDRAVGGGILWVNAAGNSAQTTWFGSYSDSDGDGRIEFDGTDELNAIRTSGACNITAQLRWEDSWGGATRDFDLYIVDTFTGEIVASSVDTQSGESEDVPLEIAELPFPEDNGNDQYALGVVHHSGSVPDWLQLTVWTDGSQSSIEHYTLSGSITSPAESANPGLLAVGAAPWYDVHTIEPFSSRGPTPDERFKPDIVGADCGETALVPLEDDSTGFCGTSQAAPHVAGMAALVRQRLPELTPTQVADYLKDHAEHRESPDPNNTWGHGFALLPPLDTDVVPPPSDGCVETLTADGTVSGTWASGCDSAVAERGHARYYSFTLAGESEVTITLERTSGDAGTYLYLRQGAEAKSGALACAEGCENDDAGGTTRSRIQETLAAGSYTIEATTYSAGETGSFTLTVSGLETTAPTPLAADLVVDPPSVSDSTPDAGASFTLSATVRNRGDGASAPTTLRYYRSSDAVISSADTLEGSDSVSELNASGSGAESVSLTAPSASGTYYYGACVDAVSDESDTTNNCSTSVAIAVSAALGNPTNQRYSWQGSTIVLSWDGVAGADYYNIYYDDFFGSSCWLFSGSPSFCEELATNVLGSSYTDDDPDPDRNYYWITACNRGGCSEIDSDNPASLEGPAPAPDLVVDRSAVSESAPSAGERITLSATVRNQGSGRSGSTRLHYYQSTDSDISSLDTSIGTDFVSRLDPAESGDESVRLNAPDTLGTYYYGACVDAVSDESDTTNNCSTAVTVSVGAASASDLVVDPPSVDDGTPGAGAAFTLSATVRNQGNGSSDSTTLRYYQSADSTISASDAQVAMDSVSSLAGSAASAESIELTAPSMPGTYYYGACVDAVSDESDTTNNCSTAVTVAVGATSAPDLVVDTPTVDDSNLTAGAPFTLSATVRNQGSGPSDSTTLRYYRSADSSISSSDTAVGTDSVSGLSAWGTSAEDISLTAPSTPGTYYYGACVDSVSGESDTGNNCSGGVAVAVFTPPAPDLIVESPTVGDSAPAAGGSFTLSAAVRNQGSGSSDSTTLRYYRSTDSTITSGDTEVGTDSVSSLDASESSPQTISLSAPSTPGTYYYGACVDAVDGEANTSNDCSDGVKVTVVAVAPGVPTELSATASGPTEIVLSWNAPAYNGGEAITGYRIEMSPDGSDWSDLVADTNSTGTNYSHTGLVLGDTRHYRVSTINSAGTGPASNVASATTTSIPSGNASAARSFSSASVAPGGQVTVTITAANYGPVGRVTEMLPQGFSYVSSSLSDFQVTEVDARTVRFDLLGNASFTYTVTASSVEDSYSFSGTLTDSDRNEHVVGGAATVTVHSGDPLVARYDANGDGAIDIGELFTAIDDYFAGLIGIGELFTLIDLYFSGPA